MLTSFVDHGPLVIIEGTDGSGKTTLMQEAWPDYSHFHQGKYDGRPVEETLDTLHAFRGPLVCDRLHLGEMVYGPIFRGRDTLGPAGLRMLDRVMFGRQAVLILATPSRDRAMANWHRRHAEGNEMFTDAEKMRQVWQRFREVIWMTHLPFLLYDWSWSPLQVRQAVERIRPPINEGPGVGYWMPRLSTLVIGERVSESATKYDFPFVADTGCARWLADQLTIPERHLYWVNVLSRDGRQVTDPAFVERLRPRQIVCLGGVARDWAADHNLARYARVHLFEHPAYHMRFKGDQPYPAADVINRLVRE